MAQTKKKRRRKRRGTQGGRVDTNRRAARPPVWSPAVLVSLLIGAATHSGWDAFTHTGSVLAITESDYDTTTAWLVDAESSQRQRVGSGHALQSPREDEHTAAGGCPGQSRRGRESDDAPDERIAPSVAVADGPASLVTEQVANGVAVRMAVLYSLLGSGAPVA